MIESKGIFFLREKNNNEHVFIIKKYFERKNENENENENVKFRKFYKMLGEIYLFIFFADNV
jgi:hypothetical protein